MSAERGMSVARAQTDVAALQGPCQSGIQSRVPAHGRIGHRHRGPALAAERLAARRVSGGSHESGPPAECLCPGSSCAATGDRRRRVARLCRGATCASGIYPRPGPRASVFAADAAGAGRDAQAVVAGERTAVALVRMDRNHGRQPGRCREGAPPEPVLLRGGRKAAEGAAFRDEAGQRKYSSGSVGQARKESRGA